VLSVGLTLLLYDPRKWIDILFIRHLNYHWSNFYVWPVFNCDHVTMYWCSAALLPWHSYRNYRRCYRGICGNLLVSISVYLFNITYTYLMFLAIKQQHSIVLSVTTVLLTTWHLVLHFLHVIVLYLMTIDNRVTYSWQFFVCYTIIDSTWYMVISVKL